jgi:RNA-directed DNA polymerase
MYHRHVVSKEVFQDVDSAIWTMLWKWSRRRHRKNKNMRWVKQRYFIRHKGRDWTFFARNKMGGIETILRAGDISIIRYPKIRGHANPYDKEDELYFENRIGNNMLNKLDGKHMMCYLYDRQKGLCLVCNKGITLETGWNIHHLLPKHLGGKWIRGNLVMLHPVCHIQVHQNDSVAAALTKAL